MQMGSTRDADLGAIRSRYGGARSGRERLRRGSCASGVGRRRRADAARSPVNPRARGSPAYFGELFLRARFAFEFEPTEIELGTELAVERVNYRVTMWSLGGQKQTEDVGKGLHVYRRQTDGTWKLQIDVWNSDRPAALQS